jgi:hypothetical protein
MIEAMEYLMSTHTTAAVCQPSNGQETDWSTLYESAFPADERMALADVQAMLTSKTMLLHRTTNAAGELLCFSLVTPMSNFSLLAYIATDQTKRSTGVGSKHMKELLNTLKNTYQQSHVGLFLEIESTREANLSVDETANRKRRLAFYQRLNCRRLTGKDYLLPSYTAGGAARAGELLWYEYGAPIDAGLDKFAVVSQVISEIYTRGYGLAVTDPSYVQVMAQFATSAPAAGNTGTASVAPADATPAVSSDSAVTAQ